ncbi:hypothetical protein [Pseudobacteroides cellulosolvens]|uniref:Uncharacterized protein n=1 Tax=Pseudobacteroides cellulosolvens ATCC 35603 = DSM 2933 TaxID=398512 RepID=A0A0L6JWE3_9FIRM|nr:hypothetical protein [Pseudobacteroides cellulosolvens]KNY30163.1 hypothetical protein Bccel_5440 [Pseudobacteroides cellulosolvens ATCC 35603 = DSM 2933]
MGRVNIEKVIDHLNSDIRKALRDAVEEVTELENFDEYELFRTFKRKVRSKCNTWENVPDNYIEKDY